MYRNDERAGWRRAGALASTLAIHGALAALLFWGLSWDREARRAAPDPVVAAFEVQPPPPPPEADADLPPDAAAPEGRSAEALPVEAPQPVLPIAPVPAAPEAGEGNQTEGGAGAQGAGPGAGGAGSGGGGGGAGGVGSPARRIAGHLSDSDYPRAAGASRMSGVVGISFRVRTDGRADRCTIVRSSGHALLDELTCRLFTQRYRFIPATTAGGQPVESTLQTSFTWTTRRR